MLSMRDSGVCEWIMRMGWNEGIGIKRASRILDFCRMSFDGLKAVFGRVSLVGL
jgi:hypothetical protein